MSLGTARIVGKNKASQRIEIPSIRPRHNSAILHNEITPFIKFVYDRDTSNQFGSKVSDFVGINIDADRAIRAVRDVVVNILTLKWDQIDDSLLDVVKSTANLIAQTNPLTMGRQLIDRLGMSHQWREVDKLTGLALKDAENLTTLPARAVRGDGISQAELINDALFALKVVAVAASVGTASYATTLISQTSAQMSKGTLGQTPLGQALLAIGAQAGGAALTGGDVLSAAGNESIRQGVTAGVGEGVKSAGGGELVSVVGGAVSASSIALLTGGSATSALTDYGKGTLVSQAGKKGGVVGEKGTSYLLDKGFTMPGSSDASKQASDADSGGGFFNISLPDLSAPVIGNPISRLEEIIKNINLSPSAPSGGIDIGMPSVSIPDLSNLPLDRLISNKRAVKRGGKTYYQYELDNGEWWEAEAPTKLNWWLIGAMLGGMYIFTRG